MAKRRHRPSSIDILPEEIKSLIGKLRRSGVTIDAILARLNELEINVSRSALGRHIEKLPVIQERIQRSRDISMALVDRFGDEPDNRTQRLNIEILQSIIMDILTNETSDAETGENKQVVLDPEQVMFIGRTIKDLASAQKTDADRMLKMRQEMAKEVDKAVSETALQKWPYKGYCCGVAGCLARQNLGSWQVMAAQPQTEIWNSDHPETMPVVLAGLPQDEILLGYQAEASLAVLAHALLVIEKSRRIGLSWGLSADASIVAASNKEAGGMNVYYMGYNQNMARQFIADAAMWAKAFSFAVESVGEIVLKDGDKDINAFRIAFASGYAIIALPSAARVLRSTQGWVILDEAAFMDDLPEVIKAALALTVWGGRVTLVSTHDGVDNPFNQLIDEIKAGRQKGEVLTLDFNRALADGLYERVKLMTPANAEKPFPSKEEWIAEILAIYGENADEELFCKPKSGGGSWIAADDYTAAESASAGKPELYSGGRVVIGRDVARRRDYAVIWAFEIVGRTMWLRERWEKQNASFAEQDEVFDSMMHRYNAIAGIDQTGMGEKVVEDAQRRWGTNRVVGILFSAPMKIQLATAYRDEFEQGTIKVVIDPMVRADHRSVKRASRTSKALSEGEVHPDCFWAGALAAWLKSQGYVVYEYSSAKGSQ